MTEIHTEEGIQYIEKLGGPISSTDLESYDRYPHLNEFELVEDLWLETIDELKKHEDVYRMLLFYLDEFEGIGTDDPLNYEDWSGQEVNVKTWKWSHDDKQDLFIDICAFPGDNGAIWLNDQIVALNSDMDIVSCEDDIILPEYVLKTLAHIRFLGSDCNHEPCNQAWKVRQNSNSEL